LNGAKRGIHGEKPSGIPSKGDRIELCRTATGAHRRGTVFYADQLQIS
jgi:hypothetical protein